MSTRRSVRMLKREDISLFCENLAMLLRAGIPLYVGFSSIVEEFVGTQYEDTIKQVDEVVTKTGSLTIALTEVPCVPDYMVQMVTIGEQSGRLEEVLEGLSVYYERMDGIQKKIRSTVFYPLILLIMMTGAIIVLITAVLPIFNSVLSQFDAELTANATTALNWATYVSYGILGLIAIIVIAAIIIWMIGRSKGGQRALSGFMMHFPLTKNVYSKLSVSQFVSVMALLLKSGITPEKALDMSIEITTEKNLAKKLKKSKQLVVEGAAWGDALEHAGIFSPLGNRLIMIGLRAGTLDSSMEKIAELYDDEVNEEFNTIIAIIEPTLIAVLTIIIGVIMLAAMLPLIRIIPTIG